MILKNLIEMSSGGNGGEIDPANMPGVEPAEREESGADERSVPRLPVYVWTLAA